MKKLLILILLINMVSAEGFIYVTFNDRTGDLKDVMYVYQNDSISHRFIKELYFNETAMQTIGAGYEYKIVLNVDDLAYYSNFNTKRIVYLMLYKYWFLIGGLMILLTLMVVLLTVYKKGALK